MQITETILTRKPDRPSGIMCAPLSVFDLTNVQSVQRAFQTAMPISLQQTWLNEEEMDFAPAIVRVGWRNNSLLVFAELVDADIFNGSTKANQRAWELGDVFEIYLRSASHEQYVEFQITPDNHRLQLRYPDAKAVGWARETGGFDKFLLPEGTFHSTTWIENRKWFVFAEIPAAVICGSTDSIEGTQWRFSFGRYDYTRGVQEPVISSSSLHREPDFHRLHEWDVMTFQNSLVIQNP